MSENVIASQRRSVVMDSMVVMPPAVRGCRPGVKGDAALFPSSWLAEFPKRNGLNHTIALGRWTFLVIRRTGFGLAKDRRWITRFRWFCWLVRCCPEASEGKKTLFLKNPYF